MQIFGISKAKLYGLSAVFVELFAFGAVLISAHLLFVAFPHMPTDDALAALVFGAIGQSWTSAAIRFRGGIRFITITAGGPLR